MAKKKEFYLHPYTVSFDRDGVHMLEETSAGDRGYTIPRWKIPKIKADLKLDPQIDLFTFLSFWPKDQGAVLHQLFQEHATDRVVYWDQDDFDRHFGTTWD